MQLKNQEELTILTDEMKDFKINIEIKTNEILMTMENENNIEQYFLNESDINKLIQILQKTKQIQSKKILNQKIKNLEQKETFSEKIENAKNYLFSTLKSNIKKNSENIFEIKKYKIKIYIIENEITPFEIEQKSKKMQVSIQGLMNFIDRLDKFIKLEKTTHIGMIQNHHPKTIVEEYFYETKNYWVTWWGRKFTKDGRCIKNWSKDHIIMETLKLKEENKIQENNDIGMR